MSGAVVPYGTLGRLLADSAGARAQLDKLTRQVSSGRVADTYAGLGAAAPTVLDLRPAIAAREAWQKNIDAASGRMGVAQTTLERIGTIAQDFYAKIPSLNGLNAAAIDSVAANARDALREMAGLLNAQAGGVYVFAGQDSSNPPVPNPDDANELDPKTFGGRAMTYYGRWTYKFEIAMEKGAAGALIIHETDPAGYPFSVVQSKTGEQFDLVTPDKNMGRAAVEGWISLDRGRDLLRMAGQDFGTLKSQAATREFRPVPLGVRASMTIRNSLRTIDSRNVVARIDGRDPKLKDEVVVYSAHWDHLGVGPAVNGDTIYNGAKDNGVGVASMLELARAFTKLPTPPKRSIVFLAVTAEEQGLLGSQYYAVTPIYPLAKTLANINVDGMNVHGRTRDLTLVGLGASDLDDYARDAAGEQGRILRPDPEPEKGFYYRSDHFNFAKQGVPALDPDEGVEFVGKPAEFGERVRGEWNERDYHQPSDIVRPDWDLSGAFEDLKVFFAVGYRVADADTMPAWKPGNEFKARRDEMLKAKK